MYEYRSTILRVVDGDTIDVSIDLGFDISHKERVRLYGVDTPELRGGTDESKALAKTATAFVVDRMPIGSQQVIKTQYDRRGKYGRILADFLLEDGQSLCELLVSEGLAKRT